MTLRQSPRARSSGSKAGCWLVASGYSLPAYRVVPRNPPHRSVIPTGELHCAICCGVRSGVLHPLSLVRDDRLTSPDIDLPTPMGDPYHSRQNDRELVELGTLSRLAPSLRTAHVRHAD